ncbi:MULTISPECIES: hypothetical protein [Burkholderia cepacia complex]|uniref:hypothetical protein n=1 Tax=Burkholderia cepacia complex TaxID=87882 RepID=UPI000A98B8C9|nr:MULTISPECIES: hypothetical protein [Burkholderia cepacia complex]MCO8393882.1 hypothetical protein [Burkholderia cenocepacia]MCO8402238.1 hypothetical protein [Burkholderia cenocepacia]MCO8416347.1 hypothetical protein [Burkholderia cenocepacia]MCO8444783.1 hypothetical protein [Burkholderia cenocepacia]MCO8454981.1 hypothetical protein [Burkholderia multivorans]
MSDIRELGLSAIDEVKRKSVSRKKSLKQIFREELVFWETELRIWCREDDYYDKIKEILFKAGYEVSHSTIGYNLSVVAKEIGFDRKTKKLDGRKATRKKHIDYSDIDKLSESVLVASSDSKVKLSLREELKRYLPVLENELYPALIARKIPRYKFICEEILAPLGYDVNPDYLRKMISNIKKKMRVEGGEYE